MPDAVRRPAARRSIPLGQPLLIALAAALLAIVMSSVVAPAGVLGATSTKTVLCTANARMSSPSTAAPIATTLKPGTKVTVTATLTGSSWSVSCGGQTTSGDTWYRISSIDGRSVLSLYRVTYLFAATGLISATGTTEVPPPPVSTTDKLVACSVFGHATGPTSSSRIVTTLKAGTKLTVTATLKGSAWTVTCAGKKTSSNTWYRISEINGKTVKSLYRVTYLFAATAAIKAAAVTAPPPGLTEGIDVSHWQGAIDWAAVKAAGKRFTFIKASEATDFVDPNYVTNRTGANAAGLLIGAYHFAQPDATPGDAAAEADHFLATAQMASGDLLPVLDLEVSGGLSTTDLQAWVRDYLGEIYDETGVRGVIYMSPAFWAKYAGDTTWFADNGYRVLWVAHWTTASTPTLPADDWGGFGWSFWQYTSSGSVAGITGRVDLDRFAGSDFSGVRIP